MIGVALGYITRSTIGAIARAAGWVLFAELAILHTLAPHLAKWLVTGARPPSYRYSIGDPRREAFHVVNLSPG